VAFNIRRLASRNRDPNAIRIRNLSFDLGVIEQQDPLNIFRMSGTVPNLRLLRQSLAQSLAQAVQPLIEQGCTCTAAITFIHNIEPDPVTIEIDLTRSRKKAMKRVIANMEEQGLDEHIDMLEPFLKKVWRKISVANGSPGQRQATVETYLNECWKREPDYPGQKFIWRKWKWRPKPSPYRRFRLIIFDAGYKRHGWVDDSDDEYDLCFARTSLTFEQVGRLYYRLLNFYMGYM
jgi:hypothetical protein